METNDSGIDTPLRTDAERSAAANDHHAKWMKRFYDPSVYDRKRFNYWDCFSMTPNQRENFPLCRLFAGANLGNAVLNNMWNAGTFGPGTDALIDHWYARTNISHPMLEAWSHMVTVTMSVSDQMVRRSSLFDLLRAGQWAPWASPPSVDGLTVESDEQRASFEESLVRGVVPTPVPSRYQVSVAVGIYSTTETNQIIQNLAERPGSGVLNQPRIWIHMEGIQTTEPYRVP